MGALPVELQDREGIAAEVHSETGCGDPPVDAFELADCLDFEVRGLDSRLPQLDLQRRIVRVNLNGDLHRVHMDVAHELAHSLQIRGGVENTEAGAKHLAGALILPWDSMRRELRINWSLERLGRIHVHASAEAIAIRITQLRDAVIAIVDPVGRKTAYRRASPWLTDPRLKKITRWERDLAAQAWDAGAEVRGTDNGLCYAIPVVKGDYQRVVVVCELEQLSLRL